MTLGDDLQAEIDSRRAARKQRLTVLLLIVGYIMAMALLVWRWS